MSCVRYALEQSDSVIFQSAKNEYTLYQLVKKSMLNGHKLAVSRIGIDPLLHTTSRPYIALIEDGDDVDQIRIHEIFQELLKGATDPHYAAEKAILQGAEESRKREMKWVNKKPPVKG